MNANIDRDRLVAALAEAAAGSCPGREPDARAYVDGTLAPDRRPHLLACAACSAIADGLRARRSVDPDELEDAHRAVLAAVEERLAAERARAAGAVRVDATALAQYVRLESCERFLWHRLHPDETEALFESTGTHEQPLTPLLAAKGETLETEIADSLRADPSLDVLELSQAAAADTLRSLLDVGRKRIVLLQARVAGRLGPFPAGGKADLILASRAGERTLDLEIQDIKASRKDRVEHRLQVAFYANLVAQMLAAEGVGIGRLRTAVRRADATVEFDPLPYQQALDRLAAPGGAIARAAAAKREETSYHLTYKCDGCPYNALCARDAAESRSLSLVPFLSPVEKTALADRGVRTVDALAGLKEIEDKALRTPEAQRDLVSSLETVWPIGPRLDEHIQRAKAVARRGSLPWIIGSGFGSLPDPAAHEGLVRVYLDAQYDYLEDRVYALSALVVGPKSRLDVCALASSPPDDEAERGLIVGWLRELLAAIAKAAGAPRAPLHLYLYDRHDQVVLLEALGRHLASIGTIAAFHDLLTETAATSQNLVSFLADEVRDRRNLGILAHSLPMVARRMGFDWAPYHRAFRARVFDNARPLPDGRVYESAARFNSQVPLEYAYAVWKRLPRVRDRRLVAPFQAVTRDDLAGFLAARVRALAHVEEAIQPKSRFIEKAPVDLAALAAGATRPRSLDRALVEFLHLEHQARLQTRLLHYARPMHQRVASGESLLVEHLGGGRYRPLFREVGIDPAVALKMMGPQDDDWMVLGPAQEGRSPRKTLHGRLVRVASIRPDAVALEPLAVNFPRESFAYFHEAVELEKGARYMVDPMADDLVARRVIHACENARHNSFLRIVEAGAARRPTLDVPRRLRDGVREFLDAARPVADLTPRQREAVEGHLEEPILLVQGPPGTGKTSTIAWALLARAWAHARAGEPWQALVSSFTHTAVTVTLLAVVDRIRRLGADRRTKALAQALQGLGVLKEASVPSGDPPPGLSVMSAEAIQEDDAPRRIVGAVVGGVHRILKARFGRTIDWTRSGLFDLGVIDEASQVGLPSAVMIGAAVRGGAPMLVVGDHRQMPPIFAVDWEREHRLDVKETGAFSSAFEFLVGRAFPRVALDRSFRLHRRHAEFLDRHVYREDAVGFHSTLERALEPAACGDPFVDAVLRPDVPVVIVEHDEARSLKRNDLEIELVSRVVTAALERLGLDGATGVGVVVPHRAQRAALQERFPRLAEQGAIDTVERFQGSERDLIIVSATASDPDFVLAEASFLLNPNRLNVAFSRPRKKLVVIASSTVFGLLPPDLETFEDAALWKRMRAEFGSERLFDGAVAGVRVVAVGRRA